MTHSLQNNSSLLCFINGSQLVVTALLLERERERERERENHCINLSDKAATVPCRPAHIQLTYLFLKRWRTVPFVPQSSIPRSETSPSGRRVFSPRSQTFPPWKKSSPIRRQTSPPWRQTLSPWNETFSPRRQPFSPWNESKLSPKTRCFIEKSPKSSLPTAIGMEGQRDVYNYSSINS